MTSRIRWLAGGAVLAAAGVVAVSEGLHWRASRRFPGTGPWPAPGQGSEAVLVLGYPARPDGSTSAVQRWRCAIAARSLDPGRAGTVVFSGAAGDRDRPEAEVMADYTRDTLGVPAGQIALETQAHNTWQNVKFTLPLLEQADVIKVASDPLHAARARRNLRALRPDLAARLAPAGDYRFGDHWWIKVATLGYEAVRISWRLAERLGWVTDNARDLKNRGQAAVAAVRPASRRPPHPSAPSPQAAARH